MQRLRGWLLGLLVLAFCSLGCGSGEPEAPAPDPVTETPPRVLELPAASRGNAATTRPLELAVEGAKTDGDELVVHLRLANVTQDSFALTGDLGAADITVNGRSASDWSAEMARFEPNGGFAPGSVRRGWIRLPATTTNAPYVLKIRGFDDVGVAVDPGQPLPKTSGSATPSTTTATSLALSTATRRDATPKDLKSPDLQKLRDLQSLLDQQSLATQRQDVASYLSTFVSDRATQDRELELFQNSRAVPLAEIELRSPERLQTLDDGRLQAQVLLIYRLEGLPQDNPFLHPLLYRLRSENGALRVERIEEDHEDPVPWRLQKLTFQRSQHFLIYGDEQARDAFFDVTAELETAYAALQSKQLPIASGYAVHLAPESFGQVGNNRNVVGLARSRLTQLDGETIVHNRAFWINELLVRGRRARNILREERRTTLVHELVHLALSGPQDFVLPSWLKEGAAVYFSDDIDYQKTTDLTRRLDMLNLPQLTSPLPVFRKDLGQALDTYLYAGHVVKYLVQGWGRETFLEFYQSFGEDIANRHTLFNKTEVTTKKLQEYYGLSLVELDNAVKKEIRLLHR